MAVATTDMFAMVPLLVSEIRYALEAPGNEHLAGLLHTREGYHRLLGHEPVRVQLLYGMVTITVFPHGEEPRHVTKAMPDCSNYAVRFHWVVAVIKELRAQDWYIPLILPEFIHMGDFIEV